MATRLSVVRQVKDLGGTVEDTSYGPNKDYNLDAPAGSVWACDELHSFVVAFRSDIPGDAAEAWADAEERISQGLVPCTTKDCDCCEAVYPRGVRLL